MWDFYSIISTLASTVSATFSQDSLNSGTTLEESSGMDMDAEAVIDAENNINTARWDQLMVTLISYILVARLETSFKKAYYFFPPK